jgi:hypothetical protein
MSTEYPTESLDAKRRRSSSNEGGVECPKVAKTSKHVKTIVLKIFIISYPQFTLFCYDSDTLCIETSLEM